MKLNEGVFDRVVRIILALVLGTLYFTNVVSGTLGIILLIVAIVMLLTGAIGNCPLYCALKINTRKGKE